MDRERKKTNSSGHQSEGRSRRIFVDDFYLFIDNNLRVIRYCLYGIGAVGLLIAARSLHLHKKFLRVQDIPAEFLKKNVSFRAEVKQFDKENSLHVEHIPILVSKWLPFNNTASSLLVKVAGVQISPGGCQWLTDNVINKMIKVTPLYITSDTIHSIVHLEQGLFRRSVCVNKVLVQRGLCKVDCPSPLPSSSLYIQLLDDLVAIESKADKKGTGMWGGADTKDIKRSSFVKLNLWIQRKFVKRKKP